MKCRRGLGEPNIGQIWAWRAKYWPSVKFKVLLLLLLLPGYLEVRGQESIATMIRWVARVAAWLVTILTWEGEEGGEEGERGGEVKRRSLVTTLTLGIFFSAATKTCLLEPCTGMGCSMPQYWRYFLRTIPTTLPATWRRRGGGGGGVGVSHHLLLLGLHGLA